MTLGERRHERTTQWERTHHHWYEPSCKSYWVHRPKENGKMPQLQHSVRAVRVYRAVIIGHHSYLEILKFLNNDVIFTIDHQFQFATASFFHLQRRVRLNSPLQHRIYPAHNWAQIQQRHRVQLPGGHHEVHPRLQPQVEPTDSDCV